MNSSRPTRRPRRRSDSPKSAAQPQAQELHPVDNVPDIATFREMALSDDVQDVIAGMGITEPTPIQKLAINPVLEGRDVIAKAETGTGKTLAFGAPMMTRIEPDRATVLGLVLCPTRELAQQVWQVLVELGEPQGIKVALVVGGDPMHPQVDALKDGAQVVVGTPGRVLDLYNQRFLSFPWTEFTILDEADEMLEIGFIDDVRKILDFCPDERQTLLFSATFPPELLRLARDHTKNPVEVATAKGVVSVETITHYVMRVEDADRPNKLKQLIGGTADSDVLLVFCDRRVEVERVFRSLERTRWSVKALHGGYDQAARFRVMSAFREGSVKVLVATDVASRGLDIKHVTHVINYSVPRSVTAYTHRSGRTGRAGRKGAALTMVTPADGRRWNDLVRQMTWSVQEFGEQQQSAPESPVQHTGDSERGPRRSRSTSESRGRRGERSRGSAERGSAERGSAERGSADRSSNDRSSNDRSSAGRGEAERPRQRRRSREETTRDGGREPELEMRRRVRREAEERESREAKAAEKPETSPREERGESERRPRRRRRSESGEGRTREASAPAEDRPRRQSRSESRSRERDAEPKKDQPKERERRPPKQAPPREEPGAGGFGAGV